MGSFETCDPAEQGVRGWPFSGCINYGDAVIADHEAALAPDSPLALSMAAA